MFDNLTDIELIILEDALTEYAMRYRTIRYPNQDDRILTENEFLGDTDINPVRIKRYITALAMRAEIRAKMHI
jgi:hypothetical protein